MKNKLIELIDKYNFDNKDGFINFYNECEKIFIRDKANCILISQFDGIGDAILISGCIKFLKEYYKLPLIIACYDFVKPIFINNPYIDKIITLEKTNELNSKNYLKNIITLINNELWGANFFPKEAYHFQYAESNQTAYFFNYFSGAKNRIGFHENDYKMYYTNTINFSIDQLLINKHIILPKHIVHMVDRAYFILENYLSVNIKNKDIFVYINEEDNNYIQKYLKNINIIINLGASNKNKKYPSKQLNEFLHKVYNSKYNFILIGGENDVDNNITIPCINLIGKLSINQSIALIKNSNLYIGNDTGMTHAAAACKTPCMVFYKESKNQENIYPERLSSYLQFFPYKTKAIGLRPEKALLPCSREQFAHSGCIVKNSSHCIRQIKIKDIIEAFYKLI